MDEDVELDGWIERAAAGDQQAAALLFQQFHERLLRMVRLRLDPRLRGRVDEEDVLQETYLDAARRLPDYARDRSMTFFLWLRFLAAQKLVDAARRHLGVKKRSAEMEVSLYQRPMPDASTFELAVQLLGRHTSPSNAAIRAERQRRIQEALGEISALDREVLVLRHFEQLSNRETAEALGIGKSAASKRYVAALKRLKSVLSALPGFPDASSSNERPR